MMTHVKRMALIFKLNLKLQWLSQTNAIIVMHIYLLRNYTLPNTAAAEAKASNSRKKVIFKNCGPLLIV